MLLTWRIPSAQRSTAIYQSPTERPSLKLSINAYPKRRYYNQYSIKYLTRFLLVVSQNGVISGNKQAQQIYSSSWYFNPMRTSSANEDKKASTLVHKRIIFERKIDRNKYYYSYHLLTSYPYSVSYLRKFYKRTFRLGSKIIHIFNINFTP